MFAMTKRNFFWLTVYVPAYHGASFRRHVVL